jgi:molybdopterin-guanine dinucleotide biosynthesis protein A
MLDALHHFEGAYKRLLFVPVDMPLMDVGALRELLLKKGNVYFDTHPLPACLHTTKASADCGSVKALLKSLNACALPVTPARKNGMVNINTPQEWENIA